MICCLPSESAFLRLEESARTLATRYGYLPIETPIFEQSAVFERGVGEVTDVVEKELFRVQAGRGEDAERERWALRPEPTAGIVRAYVQHGMRTWAQPVRLLDDRPDVPLRPPAGRAATGSSGSSTSRPSATPDRASMPRSIELALAFLAAAGLADVQLRLNSIGDAACRPAYVEALRAHFGPSEDELPELERARLRTSPLRLLDSKDERMAALIDAAPVMSEYLCAACRAHLDGLLEHLDRLGIEPVLTPSLVRGLDYYTRTAFELYRPGAEGQQQALGGGGRYDGLVELLGGQPTPGIGFGIGIDRVALALAGEASEGTPERWKPTVVVVGADPADTAVRLARGHRAAGCGAGLLARPHEPQAQQAARGRRPGGGPLRGHLRRRAGSRQRPGARPRGRHAATGPHRRPRPRPPSRAVPPSPRRGGMTPPSLRP